MIYLMMALSSMDFLISIHRDNSQELVQSILELQATYPFFTNSAAAHSEVNDLKGKRSEKRKHRGVGRVETGANLEVRSPPHRLQPHSYRPHTYTLFFLLFLVGGGQRGHSFKERRITQSTIFLLKCTTPEATSLGHLLSIFFSNMMNTLKLLNFKNLQRTMLTLIYHYFFLK